MQYIQVVVLVLVLISQPARAAVYEARCVIDAVNSAPNQQVRGTIRLRQVDNGPVVIGIRLTDFDATDSTVLHGFHVHIGSDVSQQCVQVGGHFNPTNVQHGSPSDQIRHAGDLGNIMEVNGEVNDVRVDNIITLIDIAGRHKIIGRTLVVHAFNDDLGKGGQTDSLQTGHSGPKIACCKIVRTKAEDFKFAVCQMHGNGIDPNQKITGPIEIKQLITGGMTTYDMDLVGFTPPPGPVKAQYHGFHVHAHGSTGNNCNDAMGHYNPNNVLHGAQTNNLTRRHVGDLGNIMEIHGAVRMNINDIGSGLSGPHSIYNRALVIHLNEDDLGEGGSAASMASGNAGPRIACCVITWIPVDYAGIGGRPFARNSMNKQVASVYCVVIGLILAAKQIAF